LSSFFPNRAEVTSLRFLIPMPGLVLRFLASGLLFTAGCRYYCLLEPGSLQYLGLGMILAGHLPLWVRTVTTAPGGATPKHEDTWVPVEDTWLERVTGYEQRGERWDTTPWDISNRRGKVILVLLLALWAGIPYVLSLFLGSPALGRVSQAMAFLLVPLWFNGMRTIWHPSELRKKGDALAVARASVEESAEGDFEFVPMLALRRGARGNYPVDARLMLRPAREDPPGFLGVQFQVSINSVRGTDYPYFYAVILGREGFRLPEAKGRRDIHGVDLVFEPGEKEGVRFLVVRQHADTGGGWHTEPEHIHVIAQEGLRLGSEAAAGSGREASA